MSFEVEMKRELATSLWREGRYAEARVILREATRSPLADDALLSLHVMLSIVDRCRADYASALRTVLSAGRLVETCRDDILKGKFHNTLGAAYLALKDYDRAMVEFTAAAVYHERAKAFLYAAQTKNNVGNLYLSVEMPAESLRHFDDALNQCDDAVTRGQALDSKAKALLALNRLDEAEDCAHTSYRMLKELGDEARAFLSDSALTWAEVRLKQGVRMEGR